MSKRALILGAGTQKPTRRISLLGSSEFFDEKDEVITLDMNDALSPNVVFDLSMLHLGGGLPFLNNYFDEIHAYEVLEHVGQQGDWLGFFREWKDYWRILKPGGTFHGSSPRYDSIWLWGDPGHTRCMDARTFAVLLSQKHYEEGVGKSTMSDYRAWWPKPYSFKALAVEVPADNESTFYVLEKEVAE